MTTSVALLLVAVFLLAGFVKGVIGLGLPMVSLGLLTVALDLPTAMALLVVPSFVTNLWQSVAGGNAKIILHRLWPFLVTATVTVWIGVADSMRALAAPPSDFIIRARERGKRASESASTLRK